MLFACNPIHDPVDSTETFGKDSVAIFIERSKDKLLDIEKRKEDIRTAYQLNKTLVNDSIKNRNLLKISFQAHKLDYKEFFKKVNNEALNLSNKLRDTFAIGDAHWNFGNYYVKIEVMDSAYLHYYMALKNFETIKHDYYAGKMMFNMAFVQGRVKDYTGSEISVYKAIANFKKLKKNRNLYLSYDHLRVIYIGLEEYDKALYYHNIANNYVELSDKKGLIKEKSLNNLGLIYQNQGSYKKAIATFEKALNSKKLKEVDINLYAKLIDNKAYNRLLLGDSTNLLPEFLLSLRIRDSLNNLSGVVISKLHLAEYYADYKDTLNSIKNLNEAFKFAKTVNNNRDVLTSLRMLSNIDKTNAKKHLINYLNLNDSLQKAERKIRNKFTRIRFETDEYIKETKYLSKQKKWILIISVFLISILSLLYYIKRQNAKNKELIFEKEQQNANEEIYSLLLKHQAKMEEGRLQERNRISEDLHDGILGKLFGTRMAFGFLNLKGATADMKKYNSYLDEMQQIEKEIRTISHELKSEILSSNLDFIDILNEFMQKQSKVAHFKYNIKNDTAINWRDIDEKIKINLYRIILEAMQNIAKYADASQVNIDFKLVDNVIYLCIEDNGIGFDIFKKNTGIGLKNMRSRTQKLKGKFTLRSIPDKGTKITISIPLNL